jgi:NAD(P)-dependent dehydrogenase (short-subunit alcohol dehydrogenase family)
MGEGESARVLVTGASQGIGRAIVMRLARRRNFVLAVSRSKPQYLDANRFQWADHVAWTSLDLSNAAAVEQYTASLETFPIRALILSAVDYGEGARHGASTISTSEWQRVIGTNLVGQSVLVSRLLPKLVRTSSGVIINVSSDVAVTPATGRAAYGASKAGLHAMLRAVEAEHRADGLQVYQLIPTFQSVTEGIRRRRPAGFDFSSYADPALIAEVVERILSGTSPVVGGTYLVRRDATLDPYDETVTLSVPPLA